MTSLLQQPLEGGHHARVATPVLRQMVRQMTTRVRFQISVIEIQKVTGHR